MPADYGMNALIAQGIGRAPRPFDFAEAQGNALQFQAQSKGIQLAEQEMKLRELALDVKTKALNSKGKISLDYPDFTIEGESDAVAAVADAVQRFPGQANDPQFLPWAAKQGVSIKAREAKEPKVSPYGPEALSFAEQKARIEAKYREPKEPKEPKTKTETQLIEEALTIKFGRPPTAQEILDEKAARNQANAPKVFIGTDENGNPLVMNNKTGTVTPATVPEGQKLQPKPAHMPNEMIVAEQQISTLQNTLNRVDSNYDSAYVGPVAGRLGALQEQWTGIPEKQAMFYADLAQINNSLVYLMSGKQINEQEYKRLLKQLPVATLPEGVFKSRMKVFKETLSSILEERHKNMKSRGIQSPEKTGNTVGRFKVEVE